MLLTLAFLILLGLFLLFVELFVVPGITFVGIIGTLLLAVAIYFIFDMYGQTAGISSLVAVTGLSGFVIYRSVQTRFWKRFSLKDAIESKVNDRAAGEITVGMEGETISALRPMGTARFHGTTYEVQIADGMLDAGHKIVVVNADDQKIIVKPI